MESAAAGSQMGGMSIGGPQPGIQAQPSAAQPHHAKPRAKRVYPSYNQQQQQQQQNVPGPVGSAGYMPMAGSAPAPGYPQASQPGYPQAAAPAVPQQPFVPGAQVPAPMPSAGAQYPQVGGMGQMPTSPIQHAPGQPAPYEPPKPRIDPNQMPSPIAVHAHDQDIHDEQPYTTSLKTNVPLACTDFTAIDELNSNPRFVRMTMYNVPHTEELLKTSHLPLGMVVQPLADLSSTEVPVQLIDFGQEGPIRCLRCKTYINPNMTFIDGGKRFVCNMCRHENDVPDDYFCNLDMAGRRLDWESRPELRNGSVEFVATKEFVTREPAPASFVFAIDVTWNAVQSGMLAKAAEALKDTLYSGAGLPAGVKVGVITYDRCAHFYNLSPSLDQAQMMVVPDIHDIFMPLNEGFVVDPIESRHIIEPLLDSLPSMFARNHTAEPVLGAVVKAVHEALSGRGGKLFVLQTALPTLGPGTLRQRDDAKLHNTDKEKTLYEPQDSFYHDWAVKLVEEGISCSLYLFPSAYIDTATVGQLSTVTGGELYFYPGFQADRDGTRFASDIRADAQRSYGASGVLRIRTSDGLRVDEHYGNLFMRNHVDVELAGVTSDTAVAALLQYDGKLDEKQDVYFQVALLYTTSDGQRRIRVHNLAIPCTTLIGNIFRHSEMDASMNLIAKMAVSEAMNVPLRQIRDKLTDRCVQILTAYRRNCASGSSPGQLILPEAYKLSPLYTLSLLKSPALRGGADVPIDQRVYHMNLLRQLSVCKSMDYFYPTVVPVHSLSETEGTVDEKTGKAVLPSLVRASYTVLDPSGAYLLAHSGSLTLWLGRQAPSSFIQESLGAASLEQVNVQAHTLPKLDTVLNQKIHALCRRLVPLRDGFVNTQIIRQGIDPAEVQFAALLVEDRNNDNMTYVDFVCAIHRQIQREVRPKGPLEPKWSYN
ncbi:COPII coat Sec23p-Sfb3p heterodimer component [Dipsacomyces acuminosporus]|nr:COPII coat Sec23p-Sfb3p heterodimer component [Dipsacomyces acuminosporus]